ncbi:MAG: hypothetical protein ACLFPL_01555 [Candidatus Nanoarchaeia archaeon]
MSGVKAVFFYIFLLVAIVNTVLMYAQTSVFTIFSFSAILLTLIVLVLSGLLTTIALSNKRRVVKKTSYRIELFALLILFLVSVGMRIYEMIVGSIDIMLLWRSGATVLYFILFLFAVGLSRDVFKTLLEIYNNKIKIIK